MPKKKVTLSLDSKVYSEFQKYCEKNAIMLSKKIELLIKDIMKTKVKKNFLFFNVILFGLLFSITFMNLVSADLIFSDGFESGNLNDWTLIKASGANDWTASTTAPYQGSYHAQSQPGSTLEPASVMQKIISTSGYNTIILNYSRRLVGIDAADEFQVEWFDGSTWAILEQTGSAAADDLTYLSRQYSLTSGANNNANFAIRFECTAGAVSEFCRVDNVNISGTLTDANSPKFSNYVENPVNNSQYVQGQFYVFNVTITEPNINAVGIEFNGTNYTGSFIQNISNVYVFNRTNLAAGVYSYYWWANDTNGNFNKSEIINYVVAKASATISLTTIPSSPITYGTQSNFSCSNSVGLSTTLYVNGVNKSSEKNLNVIRAAGSYTVNCTSVGNQNYSESSQQSSYVINNASGQVSLLLNNVANNLSIIYPQQSNISISTLYGSVSVYLNGIDITLQNNINVTRAAEFYNVTAVSSGDQNHSSAIITRWLNITKAPTTTSVLINPSSPITYGTTSNFSCSNSAGLSTLLYINYEDKTVEKNLAILRGAGSYSVNCTAIENQNYSISSDQVPFTINKASPSGSLTNSQTWNVVYGTSVLIGYSESNFGDFNAVYKVYRDNVDKGSGESVVLGVATYNYILNTTGGQNYSASSNLDSNTLVITEADPRNNMQIIITPSSNVNYGTQTSASASESNFGDSNLVYNFYRNNSGIANPNTEILNAGTYFYEYNTSGGQNYTFGKINSTLIVNKISSNVKLYLNGFESNLTISQYQSFSVNSTLQQGVGDIYVYSNGTLIYQGASPFYSAISFDSPGVYNVSSYYLETQNFLLSFEIFWVNVTAAPDTFGPSISIFDPKPVIYISNNSLEFNYVVSDSSGVNSCWYNLDSGENTTILNCQNITFNVSSEGFYTLYLFANDSLGNSASSSVNFGIDLTGISLQIIEPIGVKTSRTNIPLIHNTIGNNLTCWYNINFLTGGLVIPNTTITNCNNISFDVSSDGDFILNLYANNSFGTLKSTNSNFSVSTSSSSSGSSSSSSGGGYSGGSGGSGISSSKKILESGSIQDIMVNTGGVKKISSWKVKNIGNKFLNDCKFKSSGNLDSWITYQETKGLAAGEEYEFVFDVNIPENLESGIYNLEVGLRCQSANISENFAVEITERQLDFKLISVERQGKDNVKVVYSIKDIAGKDQEVNVQFLLFDLDNKKVAESSEGKKVSASSEVQFESLIPIDETLSGNLRLLVNFNSEKYSGFVQENVVLGSSISGFTILDTIGNNDTVVSVILVVLFLTFTFFIVKRIKGHHHRAKYKIREMIKKNKK